MTEQASLSDYSHHLAKHRRLFASCGHEASDATTVNCMPGQVTVVPMMDALDHFPRCAPGTKLNMSPTESTSEW